MICNQKHLPTGYYSSYDNHSRASKVIGYQIEKSKEYYEQLWKDIVTVKIQNQSKAYLRLTSDRKEPGRLKNFHQK